MSQEFNEKHLTGNFSLSPARFSLCLLQNANHVSRDPCGDMYICTLTRVSQVNAFKINHSYPINIGFQGLWGEWKCERPFCGSYSQIKKGTQLCVLFGILQKGELIKKKAIKQVKVRSNRFQIQVQFAF